MSKQTPVEVQKQILELYASGIKTPDIASRFGVANITVLESVRRQGGSVRTKSQANRRYSIREGFFDEINTEASAYFLGLMYADGYVFEPSNKIRLTLQEKDKEILDVFSRYLYEDREPIKFYSKLKNHSDIYSVDVCSERMTKSLVRHGCGQKKSLTLKFPTHISKELIPHFIRGYFDGDGYIKVNINKFKQPVFSVVGTFDFCTFLKGYLEENADVSICYVNKEKRNKEKIVSILSVKRISDIVKIRDFLYSNATIYLKRKRDKFFLIEYKNQGSPVIQKNLDGSFINRFNSIKEASETTGVGYKNLALCCRGKLSKTKGFIFNFDSATNA